MSLAAALSFSTSASAATVIEDFGNIGTNFSSEFGHTVKPGSFIDDFTFSFTEGSAFSSAASAKVLKANIKPGISDFTAFLIGPNSYSQKFLVSSAPGAAYKSLELELDYLKPGSYKLETSGTAAATGGSYAGTFSVSAVPEPKTYGMLLLGLGLVVVATRRKSNNI